MVPVRAFFFVAALLLLASSVLGRSPCSGCGYSCDSSCNCGRCNTKPGCMTSTTCLTNCNGGGNAKWCGASPGPSPGPTPGPTPGPGPGDIVWSTKSNRLLRNDSPVNIHGIGSTCTEYLLRGIGMKCFTSYQWNDPSHLLGKIDETAVQPLVDYLVNVSSSDVVPAVRIPMTASSWLGVQTKASAANMAKYPGLASGYRAHIEALVALYSKNDIVSILDLHWMDDDVEQQAMATKGGASDAIQFWGNVSATFANNTRVFYELYNEPHTSDVGAWARGKAETGTAGMLEMLAAVRENAPGAPTIIAGAAAYAYDDSSLVALDKELPAGERNVLYNFHPYMGPAQAGAKNKCPMGFATMVKNVQSGTDKPLIVTEFGQACCATHGQCESCAPSSSGMGYDEQLLETCREHNVSWLPWAWRPSAGGPNTKTCQDVNGGSDPAGKSLAHPTGGKGADFLDLWNNFAPSSSPSPSPSPTPPPPGPAPSGCPGGSLAACMQLCPSTPPAAYKACVSQCSQRCPSTAR